MNRKTILTESQSRALNYKTHLSVTANAGSGKTFILTKRFIEIILNENVSLNEIAAITFTEKAASELYAKIASALDAVELDGLSNEKRRKIESLQRQLVSANISTIHSFCADLLRQYPVEANIDAAFSPIDANASKELQELSIEEVIQEQIENSSDELSVKHLIRLFGSINALSIQMQEMMDKRNKIQLLRDEIYSKSDEDILNILFAKYWTKLDQIFFKLLPALILALQVIKEEFLPSKTAERDELNSLLPKLNSTAHLKEKLLFTKIFLPKILTKDNTFRKKYLSQNAYSNCIYEISVIEEIAELLCSIEIWEKITEKDFESFRTAKNILRLFNRILNAYESKKYDSGMLDYEDLLIKTSSLLQNENVRVNLSNRFRYLMIDEYQDTNSLQYDIFLPILDELKKGNLFVVGDEKQSIYKFREAELEVFAKTKEMIEQSVDSEAIITLPESFRMSPRLCAFNNRLFKILFSDANYLYNEVEYSELICARNDKVESDIGFLICREENEKSEAELIANKILELHIEKQTAFGSIVILSPKRKYFSEIETALQAKYIPFSVVGGIGFFQIQLTLDVFNLFSFFLNKKNDVALIGILRSPFFNYSDEDIFNISLRTGESFWDKLKSASQQNASAGKAVALLEKYSQLILSKDVVFVLRNISAETNFLSVFSARTNAELNISNFEKIISLTQSFFSQGMKTLYDYVDFLKESVKQTKDEGQARTAENSDTVKIMTIHQSKGLQFENVFIAASHETPRMESARAKSIAVDREFGILTKLPADNDFFNSYESTPVLSLHDFIEEKKTIAEYKRLLYVAATRAQNNLFICGTLAKEPKRNSFLKFIGDSLKIDFSSDSTQKLFEDIKLSHADADAYKLEIKKIELNLSVQSVLSEFPPHQLEVNVANDFSANLEVLTDVQEDEIISATKVAIFNECPTKYYLTYELGYSPLLQFNNSETVDGELLNDISERIENIDSDEHRAFSISPQFRGELIHRILELELPPDEIEKWVVEQLISGESQNNQTIVDEIFRTLANFYQSDIHKEISLKENYKKEYQIYLRMNDYYLFGIIDKLIIEENRVWIIDYKTDRIKPGEIEKKRERYFTQLKFYSLLAAKYFPAVQNFRGSVIFLENPENLLEFNLSKSEALKFEEHISKVVHAVRMNSFAKNFNHCNDCFFSDEKNRCILP